MIMDEKVEYYKLPFYKRLTSIIIDIMFIVILFTLFLFPVSKVMENRLNDNEKLSECIDNMNDILIDSGLFIYTEKGMKEDISDEGITKGYIYMDDLDSYLSIKSESELFKYENDSYIEIGTKEELEKFYKDNWKIIYSKVVNTDEYKNNNNIYIEIMNENSGITYAISVISSIVILMFIVPLINKKGATLAKIIFKISVVTDEYSCASRMHIFIRQFLMIFSIITVIPFAISVATVLFEKRGKALHDYVSLTRLVDNNLLKGILLEKEKNKKDELEFK